MVTTLEDIDYSGRANWGTISPGGMGWTSPKLDPRKNRSMLANIDYTARSGVRLTFATHVYWKPILEYALELLDPHIEGSFDGENDKGSFNPQSTLQDGSPSMHAVANASDLEWRQNPMYASPRPDGKHSLPYNTDKLLRRLGIGWGGKWSGLRDWMHVENHLYPADTLELGKLITRLRAAQRKEWDEMASKEDIEAVVENAVAKHVAALDDHLAKQLAGLKKGTIDPIKAAVGRIETALESGHLGQGEGFKK